MNNNPKGTKNPKKPLIFYYAVMLLVLMMLNWLLFPSLLQRQVTEVGYDEFIAMVDDGKVQTIAYDKQDQEITFEAKNDKGKDALYKTGIFPDDELVGRLLKANVKFAAEIPTQTSPLLSMLIVGRGLFFAFLAEGAAALGLTLLVFFLVRDTPQEMGLEPYGLQDGSYSAPVRVKPKSLTCPMRWGAFLACFFIGGPSGPGFSHLTVLYTASGYPPMLTALLMSYVGLILMAGKVLYGGLVDARGSRWANRMVFLVFLAGFLLNCLAPLQNMFLAFAAVTATGLGLPISSVTLSVWAGDLSGQEDYDRTVKWFTSAYMLGSLVTGPIPGLMADHLGSYVPAYFLFAVLTALAMAIIQGLYRRLHLGLLPK